MDQPISIVIADSSPVFRYGLKSILESKNEYHVEAEIQTGEDLESWLKHNTPDLIVLDCLASGFSVDTVVACSRLPPR